MGDLDVGGRDRGVDDEHGGNLLVWGGVGRGLVRPDVVDADPELVTAGDEVGDVEFTLLVEKEIVFEVETVPVRDADGDRRKKRGLSGPVEDTEEDDPIGVEPDLPLATGLDDLVEGGVTPASDPEADRMIGEAGKLVVTLGVGCCPGDALVGRADFVVFPGRENLDPGVLDRGEAVEVEDAAGQALLTGHLELDRGGWSLRYPHGGFEVSVGDRENDLSGGEGQLKLAGGVGSRLVGDSLGGEANQGVCERLSVYGELKDRSRLGTRWCGLWSGGRCRVWRLDLHRGNGRGCGPDGEVRRGLIPLGLWCGGSRSDPDQASNQHCRHRQCERQKSPSFVSLHHVAGIQRKVRAVVTELSQKLKLLSSSWLCSLGQPGFRFGGYEKESMGLRKESMLLEVTRGSTRRSTRASGEGKVSVG